VGDHDVMILGGLDARLDLGCACGGHCQTAINKFDAAHPPRLTSFIPPSSAEASSHSILCPFGLARTWDSRLAEFEFPDPCHGSSACV
jgi:hypothetical protein